MATTRGSPLWERLRQACLRAEARDGSRAAPVHPDLENDGAHNRAGGQREQDRGTPREAEQKPEKTFGVLRAFLGRDVGRQPGDSRSRRRSPAPKDTEALVTGFTSRSSPPTVRRTKKKRRAPSTNSACRRRIRRHPEHPGLSSARGRFSRQRCRPSLGTQDVGHYILHSH